MSSKLSNFAVKIHLEGWYINGYGACTQGQMVTGADIHPRMLESLKTKETFEANGVIYPVCELFGGSVADLEQAMSAPQTASKSAESLPAVPTAPVPPPPAAVPAPAVPAAAAATVQPPMAPPAVKSMRTPRPKKPTA
jgi:hypothetical protein